MDAASGCWAMEFRAEDIARPWPIAGIITPMPVVIPAVTIDAAAIRVELSILLCFDFLCFRFLRGSSNIYCRQNAENVCLHNACYQTKYRHNYREKKRRYAQ